MQPRVFIQCTLQPALNILRQKKVFTILTFLILKFAPYNQYFPIHPLFRADQSAVYCVGILHARSSLAGGTSCYDITRRHKGIPFIKYSAERKKEKGKGGLFTEASEGIKTQRLCHYTTAEAALPHIKPLFVRTEW